MYFHEYLRFAIGDRTPAEISRLAGGAPLPPNIRKWLSPTYPWKEALGRETIQALARVEAFDARPLWLAMGQSLGHFEDSSAPIDDLLPAERHRLKPRHLVHLVKEAELCIADAKLEDQVADLQAENARLLARIAELEGQPGKKRARS